MQRVATNEFEEQTADFNRRPGRGRSTTTATKRVVTPTGAVAIDTISQSFHSLTTTYPEATKPKKGLHDQNGLQVKIWVPPMSLEAASPWPPGATSLVVRTTKESNHYWPPSCSTKSQTDNLPSGAAALASNVTVHCPVMR